MSNGYGSQVKGLWVAPRKARLVVDLVRGKSVQDALDCLKFCRKKTAPIVASAISSAVANAKNKATVDVDSLVVSEIYVDEGPTNKRHMPRAQGRATPIRKRTSRITVKLSEL